MKPTSGNVSLILAQAIQLQILCRPCHSQRVGLGEGLACSADGFWLHNGADDTFYEWTPVPSDMLGDWELTTQDLIRAEFEKETRAPW
jgi:hypothetical protein